MTGLRTFGVAGVACGLAVALLVPTTSRTVRAQDSAAALLKEARAAFRSNRLDSASALLLRVVDTLVPATRVERAEASVWLGVVRFFGGKDSLAAQAFREAFRLDAALAVEGVAQLDPEIEPLLAAARAAVGPPVATGRPPPPPAAEPLHDCQRGCKHGEEPPRLRVVPPIDFMIDASTLGPSGRRGQVVIQAVISELGRVELQSVKVLSSSSRELDPYVQRILRELFYQPAMLQGRPIPVVAQLRFEFRAEGTNQVTYEIRGP